MVPALQSDQMKVDENKTKDLLSLASAETSIEEFIEQIKQCVEDPTIQGPPNIPRRSVQLARLLLGEAVRLIRLGTRGEVADASVALVRFLSSPDGGKLSSMDPEAYRLISAASVALGAATPAASLGGDEMVLRSWDGEALRILRLLASAEDGSMTVDELLAAADLEWRDAAGPIVDLESSGLVVRYRDVMGVVVRTLPKISTPRIRRLLSSTA